MKTMAMWCNAKHPTTTVPRTRAEAGLREGPNLRATNTHSKARATKGARALPLQYDISMNLGANTAKTVARRQRSMRFRSTLDKQNADKAKSTPLDIPRMIIDGLSPAPVISEISASKNEVPDGYDTG